MKRVGVLSFHPAFTPPSSGGELRLYHLLRRVAERGFPTELITPTYGHHAEEVVEHTPSFREHRFPKTKGYNGWHQVGARAGFRECSGLVCSLACRGHGAMRAAAEKVWREADIFVHEYAFLVPLAPRRHHTRQLFIYDAHNVESLLARDMFGQGAWGRIARHRIHGLERRLVREADAILVTSENDIALMQTVHGADRARMVLVPNGVDVQGVTPCPSLERREAARATLGLAKGRPGCFFIGSFHPPNIEATDVILEKLAPALAEVDFLIAGRVCNAFEGKQLPSNVRLLGLVSEEQKHALLHGCDFALNTMLRGSGTNLKMLEYLAAGLPIVSTVVGARGIDVKHRRHALVVEPDGLLAAVEDLLTDAALRATLSTEARDLAVAQYSWDAIGDTVANLYDLRTRRRLLILNDYPVMPAEQGGQVRVEAVARCLSDQGIATSLVTLTREDTGRRIQPGPLLEEVNIPRTRLHRLADAVLASMVGCGADDVSALMFTKWLTPAYGRYLRREVRIARGVMLSHPYMEPASRALPPHVRLFYDSHNTEFDLKQKLYRPGRLASRLVSRVRRAELDSVRRALATFCVSQENCDDLARLVPGRAERMIVAPNGVDCGVVVARPIEERRALRRQVGFGRQYIAVFLGSGHPPNAEAARLIINRIARDHPRVLFLLVGSVCGWFWKEHLPGNVLVMGIVSTPVKNFLLQVSDFALNPMLTGSGTSLKLFDYMAAGLPVLSTAVGARGLTEEELEAVVLLEPDQFSAGLRDLMADPQRNARLGARARTLAEQRFDWKVGLTGMIDRVGAGIRREKQRG